MQIKSNCNEIIHAKLKSNVIYKFNILIKNEKKYQNLKNI